MIDSFSQFLYQSFYSSLIIASSTTGVLLFGILSYFHTNYDEKYIEAFIFFSFFFVILTNVSLVIAFYSISELTGEFHYPIILYFLSLTCISIAAVWIFVFRYSGTLKKKRTRN